MYILKKANNIKHCLKSAVAKNVQYDSLEIKASSVKLPCARHQQASFTLKPRLLFLTEGHSACKRSSWFVVV